MESLTLKEGRKEGRKEGLSLDGLHGSSRGGKGACCFSIGHQKTPEI